MAQKIKFHRRVFFHFVLFLFLLSSSALASSTVAGWLIGKVKKESILEKIHHKVVASASAGRLPVVVFDLDGTLYDNRPRNQAIYFAFAKKKSKKFPVVSKKLLSFKLNEIYYGLDKTLIGKGIHSVKERNAIKGFWRKHFFTNSFARYDRPFPGAVAYVRALYEDGAQIVYLTARSQEKMFIGTMKSLKKSGFPIGLLRTTLIMRPSSSKNILDYKKEVAAYLARFGRVIAAFENEPENLNMFAEDFPVSDMVLIDSDHSQNAPSLNKRAHIVKDYLIRD